ncbi:MAG TPA: hypothetical protein VJS91_08295 [Nitrososphaeraceae archaeon]|nr:hypothetical protein [Nitrososphaeraceae archaeon]
MNFSRIKYFDYIIALTSYFFLSLLMLSAFLFSPGTIGFFHDWFLGPFEEMNMTWAKNGPYAWDPQTGYKFYHTDWILRLIIGLFPSSVMGGEVLSKGFLIMVITLSGFGAFCLGKRLKLNPCVSFVAGILYIFSPLIFTKIIAGHIYYLIAYFLGPLIINSFLKGKEEKRNRYFIIAALLLSFATVQIQFLPMIFLVLLIFALVDFKRIKRSIVGLIIIMSMSSLMILSPILLSQLIVNTSEIPFNPNQLLSYFTVSTASDLAESFRMLGYEGMPYSYLNLGTPKDLFPSNSGIIPPWVFYADFLLPIIGFSVLFFRRDKYTISFAIISIMGLFLLKGMNAPLSGLFAFLFTHGLYVFRELWHIAFLYGLSITFLAVFFIDRLRQWRQLRYRAIKISLSIALVSMLAISNGYPLVLGNFAGYLQTYDFPEEYHTLYNKLLSNPQYNVLILPYINPIRYDNLRLQGLDPLITDTPSMIFPTILGNRGSPNLDISIWLLSSMQENKTHNIGKLLSGFGVKYIILRNDFVSNYPDYTPLGNLQSFRDKWYTSLEPLLDSQKDLKIVSTTNQYKIYENTNNATKIFTPSISAGGLTNFDSLLWISNQTSLSNVALYPSVSSNNSLNFLDSKEEGNMSAADFIDLGNYAVTYNAKHGWTSNRDAFGYDHLLASRVNTGLFSASPDSLVSFSLPSKYNKNNTEIWIKYLVWNQGGLANIQINGKEYPLSTFSPNPSLRILKIFEGETVEPHDILIKNIQGNNYLEGLYIKDKSAHRKMLLNSSTDQNVIISNSTNSEQNNLIANPSFSKLNSSALPLDWDVLNSRCGSIFTCRISSSEGWGDNSSLRVSTKKPHNQNITSSIHGQEIDVKPNVRYDIASHIKLNRWATQSHVALEGYNETSNKWQKLIECPSAGNKPSGNKSTEWLTEICQITIPNNVTKISPVLEAGWSLQRDKVARTWFDALSISKIRNANQTSNIDQFGQFTPLPAPGNTTSSAKIFEYNKVNPTLWNLRVSTSEPTTTIAFAEPYDQAWEATVYKDGAKIGTSQSNPLYGAINSFQIKQTGNFYVEIAFTPQQWYYVGFVISGLTFAFCVFYIIYDWRRDKVVTSTQSSDTSQFRNASV